MSPLTLAPPHVPITAKPLVGTGDGSSCHREKKGASTKHASVADLLDCTDPVLLAAMEPCKSREPLRWMIWMVHRVHINDPTLLTFDFSGLKMPSSLDHPEIAPKLASALASNTCVTGLNVDNANISSSDALVIATSLTLNTALREVNLRRNDLGPFELAAIARALSKNTSLSSICVGSSPKKACGTSGGVSSLGAVKRALLPVAYQRRLQSLEKAIHGSDGEEKSAALAVLDAGAARARAVADSLKTGNGITATFARSAKLEASDHGSKLSKTDRKALESPAVSEHRDCDQSWKFSTKEISDGWTTLDCPLLGRRFSHHGRSGVHARAQVVGWIRDRSLYKIVHDDGDEEDIHKEDLDKALAHNDQEHRNVVQLDPALCDSASCLELASKQRTDKLEQEPSVITSQELPADGKPTVASEGSDTLNQEKARKPSSVGADQQIREETKTHQGLAIQRKPKGTISSHAEQNVKGDSVADTARCPAAKSPTQPSGPGATDDASKVSHLAIAPRDSRASSPIASTIKSTSLARRFVRMCQGVNPSTSNSTDAVASPPSTPQRKRFAQRLGLSPGPAPAKGATATEKTSHPASNPKDAISLSPNVSDTSRRSLSQRVVGKSSKKA
eukprot:TRINITY_DN49020_c0_g1_i1.p1 TRINITY_DN49020_c0_g1~~TRINITY_DN49020_c0_g1_i1.p1  ORF type:complete len:620 (-),score=75.84 TRINITY_DN49020_c0_g1_i1:238-2097(-)